MNENPQSFRDRLLAAEKSTPTEKYQKELANLLERKLSPAQRTVMTGVVAVVSASAMVMGGLAIIGPGKLPLMGQVVLGTGAAGSLLGAGFIVRVLRRGTILRMKDPVFINSLIWVFSSLSVAGALCVGGSMGHSLLGIHVVLFMLYFFASASVLLMRSLLEQAELRTREKLLELEYHLAQLAGQMKNQ